MATITWLLAQGAPLDQPSTEGFTALWVAVISGNEAVALYLAKRGADCGFMATLDRRRHRRISASAWKVLRAG